MKREQINESITFKIGFSTFNVLSNTRNKVNCLNITTNVIVQDEKDPMKPRKLY